MLLEINNPREAIIESYTKPISYKNYILFKGKVIVCFRQYWLYLGMKHLLLILFFVPLISFGQEDIERYKLYPTENMWIFLELDSATGLVWQVQYAVNDDDKRFKTVLNDFVLNNNEQVNGRWKLYPTQNMYQFLLVDVMFGSVIQIQWSTEKNKRFVIGLIE